MSIVKKAMLLSLMTTIIYIFLSSYYYYTSEYNSLKDNIGNTLLSTANAMALHINPETHSKIQEKDDLSKKPLKRLSSYFKKVAEVNKFTKESIYSLRVDESKKLFWAITSDRQYLIGDLFYVSDILLPTFKKVLNGSCLYTNLYTNKHGTWLSAYSPIKQKNGDVVGIIAIDYNVDPHLQNIQKDVISLIIKESCILVFMFFSLLFIIRKLKNPLSFFVTAIKKIEADNYNLDIYPNPKSDFFILEQAFINMANILAEKFYLLRYISPQTAHLIKSNLEKHKQVTSSSTTRDHNVVIFLSNVRGLKQDNSNNSLHAVEIRDILLGIQKTIITKNGGTIDRILGDEIVATFDGDFCINNTVEVSVQIQQELAKMEFITDVRSGVGISSAIIIFGDHSSQEVTKLESTGSDLNISALQAEEENDVDTSIRMRLL